MRKILFLLLFISSISYADAGYSYRFYVKIKVDNNIIDGYIYHSSYEKYDQDSLLVNYLKKTAYKNKINLYTDIRTVNIKEFNIDFVLENSALIFNLNTDFDIEKIETLIYNGDERLIKLGYNEFNQVKRNNPNFNFINNERISENCIYIILTWEEIEKLSSYTSEIGKKIHFFSKDIEKNNEDFNNYIRTKKEDLLKKEILLINRCSVL